MIDSSHWTTVLVGLAFFLGLFPASASLPAAPITGTWTGEFKGENEIQLNLRGSGSSDQLGQSFPLVALRGLPRRQAASAAPVHFELVRDAGTVAFEGGFQDGKGGGSFTFTPSTGFVEDMASLGFRGLSSSQLLAMAMLDVSREYARELKALGFDRLSTQQLISMRIFQVTRDYVTTMRSQGYDRLPPEQWVQLRIFGVTPELVREMRDLGYEQLSADQLVQMRIFHVSPELVRRLQQEGYRHLSVDELVRHQIFGGSPPDSARKR